MMTEADVLYTNREIKKTIMQGGDYQCNNLYCVYYSKVKHTVFQKEEYKCHRNKELYIIELWGVSHSEMATVSQTCKLTLIIKNKSKYMEKI